MIRWSLVRFRVTGCCIPYRARVCKKRNYKRQVSGQPARGPCAKMTRTNREVYHIFFAQMRSGSFWVSHRQGMLDQLLAWYDKASFRCVFWSFKVPAAEPGNMTCWSGAFVQKLSCQSSKFTLTLWLKEPMRWGSGCNLHLFCTFWNRHLMIISAALQNLLSGAFHQPHQLHLVTHFCVFPVVVSSSLVHSMLFVFLRSLFCSLRPLALLSCVVCFFGEKPEQKGTPKLRLAQPLEAMRFEMAKYTCWSSAVVLASNVFVFGHMEVI